MFNQIRCLLDSVALFLRGKTTPEEFRPIESAIRMYLDMDGVIMDRPYASIGDIPQLARQHRQQREAVPAAV
jgi:hypothetical protein